jgi:hypothetical protein
MNKKSNGVYYIKPKIGKVKKVSRTIDFMQQNFSNNSLKNKDRKDSSRRRSSAVNITTTNDQRTTNPLSAYKGKTIASRHTRHKSML